MAVIRFNQAQFVVDFKRMHGAYERKSYRTFNSALKEQVKPVITYIRTYGLPSAAVIDMLITKMPMEDAYRKVYTYVGVRHAAVTYKFINALGRSVKSNPFSFFSENWRKLMESFFTSYSSQRISDVTDTTRERVKKTLADNQELPLSQQASLLESDEFTRSRAMTIARTVSTSAANYGASLGAADADYETVKQWMAVLDANTRPAHVDADGQTVDVNDNFVVGGEVCMFPGDLSLSAAECINCRCAVAYVPLLGASGLPILK